MILIDTNVLIVLILGLIDPKLISKNKRTSIYEEEDYDTIISLIGDLSNLVVLPNIITEVDNLLHDSYRGSLKESYIKSLIYLLNESSEQYIESLDIVGDNYFHSLGITDSLVLKLSQSCKLLITGDSELSDVAKAHDVDVFDLLQYRNLRFN